MVVDPQRDISQYVADAAEHGLTIERVIEPVAANSHASASEIFKALWRAASKFSDGHRQQDDMTGIVIKVLNG